MKKMNIKTKEVYSKDELKRYLGAIAEDFTNKVEVLGEGVKIIIKKQDEQTKILDSHTDILIRHEKILNSHTEMIGGLKEDVSILKDDVSILKNDVSILKDDVSTLKNDVSVIKDDMQIVKKELKKKVDYDEFLSLVQRVNKLEAKK